MNNNYYQVIDGTTMYYPEYVEQLQEENKELKEQLKIKHDGVVSMQQF